MLANEDAIAAARIFRPRGSVLAAGGIGIIPLALALVAVLAIPFGIYGYRSCISANPSAAIFARAFARVESFLREFSALPRYFGRGLLPLL